MDACKPKLKQNKDFGFYSVDPLPTKTELASFYEQVYYQNDTAQYSKTYTTEETDYFTIECRILQNLFAKTFPASERKSFLDVGCGEGYQADFFYRELWQVTCVDYSDFGLKTHHPHLLETLIQGDFDASVERLRERSDDYSIILLKNVLEHVIDPDAVVEDLKTLMDSQTLLCIDVPNDYSSFQTYLLENEYTENTWFSPPQHLHYFQFDSLIKFLQSHGLEVVSSQAEFPIEQFLVNKHSNYARDRNRGKEAHLARCRISNFLISEGVEKFIQLREAYADLEFGRVISLIVRLDSK